MPPERKSENVRPEAPADAMEITVDAWEGAPPPSPAIAPATAATGRGVRIAVIDSGVFETHPHVGGIAGGVAIALDGTEHGDYVDRLGHGTAVIAAIKEKAAEADIYAVKVFDRSLATSVASLVQAIEWAARWDMKVVNLSLGTHRSDHQPALAGAVALAAVYGVIIVAADSNETAEGERVRWLPGSLPGVIAVISDWDCPRETYSVDAAGGDGRVIFRASPYPRPVPGVPPAKNLKGISFAVANMTGFVARVLQSAPAATMEDVQRLLGEQASPRSSGSASA